jgi:transposase-like protein
MYSDIDFYKLSPSEQRSLIRNKRAATSEELLKDTPDDQPAVRVFEKSLEELILDRLESGRYTINGLASEFEVSAANIRQMVNKYRRRGQDDFTGEEFTYNILTERKGALRVKHVEGREFHYSLEKIPYFARVADPTLVQSLLFFDRYRAEFPVVVEDVPAGMATEIDETYALLLADFWDIEPQDIFDEITEYARTYVKTSLLPLPILDAPEKYEQVRERFSQPDTVYNHFRDIEQSAEKIRKDFTSLVERGQPGIQMYQVVSIEFADLRRGARENQEASVSAVDEQIKRVLSTLMPDIDGASDSDEQISEEISLEDEIMAVLDEEWRTSEEVYEALPAVPKAATSAKEVRGELDRLAGLGIISKQNRSACVEYSSESGTVSIDDVL